MSKNRRAWKAFALLFPILLAAAVFAAPTPEWSFAVIGDSRNHPEIFCKLTTLIRDDPSKPKLLLHSGDMVGAANVAYQWRDYRKCLEILGPDFPVYPAIGNHEMKGGTPEECIAIYKKEAKPYKGRLYYAFRFKNAGFIALNSEEPGYTRNISPKQMEWLKKGLSRIPDRIEVIFVVLHRPLFPQGIYRDQPMKNRNELHELFRNGGVTAVFQGHEHMYSHYEKEGVHYFTAAGGGAPLYKGYGGEFYHYLRVTVGAGSVRILAIDVDGEVRDDVSIPFRRGEAAGSGGE